MNFHPYQPFSHFLNDAVLDRLRGTALSNSFQAVSAQIQEVRALLQQNLRPDPEPLLQHAQKAKKTISTTKQERFTNKRTDRKDCQHRRSGRTELRRPIRLKTINGWF
ncbi:Hypothetical_protein [Hexamita inflata]|uniref:Hypothetical_protein n=1 Tax=Hexamita inflata TaxID=28002 RepID=A0AA86UJ88_9EUKA|nr:Hypothetical protein HINF_LOCUS40952 [Hexamita inflata]CAI9953310.1 Hypothetical protein HINF_LOCUS40955 [Hexamita inflata]